MGGGAGGSCGGASNGGAAGGGGLLAGGSGGEAVASSTLAGTRLLRKLPVPSSPAEPDPQQKASPPKPRAQEKLSPDQTSARATPAGEAMGVGSVSLLALPASVPHCRQAGRHAGRWRKSRQSRTQSVQPLDAQQVFWVVVGGWRWWAAGQRAPHHHAQPRGSPVRKSCRPSRGLQATRRQGRGAGTVCTDHLRVEFAPGGQQEAGKKGQQAGRQAPAAALRQHHHCSLIPTNVAKR
jgi:hypothetical protein